MEFIGGEGKRDGESLPNCCKPRVDMAAEDVVREAAKWTRWWNRWSGKQRGVDTVVEEVVREAVPWTRWWRRRIREEDFSPRWWSLHRTPVRWRRSGGRGVGSMDPVTIVMTKWTGRRWCGPSGSGVVGEVVAWTQWRQRRRGKIWQLDGVQVKILRLGFKDRVVGVFIGRPQ
jgi:hypothetical protein